MKVVNCVFNRLVFRHQVDELIVDDTGRAHELVDFGITLALQFIDVPLGLVDRRPGAISDAATDVSDCLETSHLISDGRLPC